MTAKLTTLDADRIFVDGHNLALRCGKVPALAKLRDRRNRPTGVLHGFLRVLLSIQKAMPWAAITVAWDGSSQRRKAMFDGYKANRPAYDEQSERYRDPADGGVPWLRHVLPFLGVEQAWNDEEECDDVIATLVRRPQKSGASVILSTDRDFLQLVTNNVRVFAPAAKSISGKGKLYDSAAVFQEYVVMPSWMVPLRAIAGDVSDNIDGAKGVGPKIALRFLSLAEEIRGPAKDAKTPREDPDPDPGSSLGVLASLAGPLDLIDSAYNAIRESVGPISSLTKLQRRRLLEAETIVRRNVALMSLAADVSVTVEPPAADVEKLLARLRDFDLDAITKASTKQVARATSRSLQSVLARTPESQA